MNNTVDEQHPARFQSNYQILKLIGQGQFGQVFCAENRQTAELVALKYLNQQQLPTKQFLRELSFLVSLQHPHIVRCQALEHNQSGRYLVLDYCAEGSLRDLIESEEQPNLLEILKIIDDVLQALEYIHSRQIVHCDLKPENILLNKDTEGWIAQIADFGIARWIQESYASTGSGNNGSPGYMAPERFYGQYSYASDLYAVGVIIFELLVGQRPFSGLPGELMHAHLNQPVQIPEQVPFCLRSVIATALQKLPINRFASAGEMLKSIRLAAQIVAATENLATPV